MRFKHREMAQVQIHLHSVSQVYDFCLEGEDAGNQFLKSNSTFESYSCQVEGGIKESYEECESKLSLQIESNFQDSQELGWVKKEF